MDQQRKPSRGSRSTIINLLRESDQASRTELAARSGFSKATISEITSDLLADGFIRERGKYQAGRGRSRVMLELEPTARFTYGVQLDDRGCTVILADLRVEPRFRAVRPVGGTSPNDFLDAICACVAELRAQTDVPVLGMGVGVPASVDPAGRVVTISVPYGWKDVPFAEQLEARLGLPVILANRAKVAALSELWRGTHPGIDDFVYLYVGEGIVAGIVTNGSLYFGSTGGAGEIGHVTILPDGPICGCGNHGCLHTLASESAIRRMVRSRLRQADGPTSVAFADAALEQVTLDQLIAASAMGDPIVLETLTEAGTYLGLAIANLINLLNPRLVVVGGPVAQFGEPLLTAIRREVRRRALWDALANADIVLSTSVESAGAVGAAALFLDHLDDAVFGSKPTTSSDRDE